MKTIRVNKEDGSVRIFNPIHITSVSLVTSEYNKDWCIVLYENSEHNGSVYTIPFHSKEEAERELEYINECLESI